MSGIYQITTDLADASGNVGDTVTFTFDLKTDFTNAGEYVWYLQAKLPNGDWVNQSLLPFTLLSGGTSQSQSISEGPLIWRIYGTYEVDLGITFNGIQVRVAFYTTSDGEDPTEVYTSAATMTVLDATEVEVWNVGDYEQDYGAIVNRSNVIAYQFNRLIALDMTHGVVYPGFGFGVTATASKTAVSIEEGNLPSGLYGTDTYGYFSQMFVAGHYGLGNPLPRIRFPVATDTTSPDDMTAIRISPSSSGFYLPTDGGSETGSFLGELPVTVEYANGTTVDSTINQNSQYFLYLVDELDEKPEAGDYVWIAPMTCGVLFAERRSPWPMAFTRLITNIYNAQTQDQEFTFRVFNTERGGVTIDLSAPKFSLTLNDEKREYQTGQVSGPITPSRALAYALEFKPVGDGTLHVEDLVVEENGDGSAAEQTGGQQG